MSDFRLKDILVDMRGAMADVMKTIFVTDRPKTLNENHDEFMVISLPVMLYNKTYGTGYGMTSSYARFEIFVRDRNGLEQTARLDELAKLCLDKFPINTGNMLMSRPRVVMSGGDGYGFHVVTIQASLVTK